MLVRAFVFVFILLHNLYASETHSHMSSLKAKLNRKDVQGSYGKGADVNVAVSLEEVFSNPDKYLDKEVTVSGEITDVCPKAGCWLKLKGDSKGRSLRIKVQDGEIVFPKASVGSRVIAKGKLSEIKFTAEQALEYFAHIAEEKKEKFDRETASKILTNLAGPLRIFQLNSNGAEIH